MSMYLRVNIPYRYALPKSPTDPSIVDVFPLMNKSSPFSDHITLSLNSVQTPWSQINKKNEVFTFDPETAFYPAYRPESKIRPKMIPQTVQLLGTTFASVKDIFKLQGSTTHDIQNDGFTTYADREKHFQSQRKKELRGLYQAYKPFLDTKRMSVLKLMDWATTQDDLVGVWNQGQVSADVIRRTTQKVYRLANTNEKEDVEHSELYLKTIAQTDEGHPMQPDDLGLSYSQKVLGFAPYSTTLVPSDATIHRPLKLRYRFVSEMETVKETLRHSDTGSWTNLTYNPPSLDWQEAGFPQIAPTKTKALYARKPVQVHTHYSENGFTKEESILFHRCVDESQTPATWFANLVEPIDPDGDVVPLFRHVQGNLIEWSALSWMERKYEEEGQVVWQTQTYDARGYGLRYRLSSDNSDWKRVNSRHRNFPTGSITPKYTWDKIPVDGQHTRRYGEQSDWLWNQVAGTLEQSDIHNRAARGVGYSDPLPPQTFKDEKLYPLLDYKIETRPYTKGEVNTKATRDLRRNTGIMVLPSQVKVFSDNGDTGRHLLSQLLNSGLFLTTYIHDPSNSKHGMNLPSIQELLEAALITRPADFEVKMEKTQVPLVVSVTQKLLRRDIIKNLDESSNWKWIAQGLRDGHKKGMMRWNYKVYFVLHPDAQGVSILLTYPTFLDNTQYLSQVAQGATQSIRLNSPNLFLLRDHNKEVIGIERGNMNTALPFSIGLHHGAAPLVEFGEIMEYLNSTAFGGYQYSLLHLRDGLTLSDPVNTLPMTYKRGKLSVEGSFTYTSPIPVIGEKLTTLAPLQMTDIQNGNAHITAGRPPGNMEYSPVAQYTISPVEEETQLSLPTYEFKPQNANSRMNKYRRSGRRHSAREGYGDGTKPNDYRIYSQFILPFGDFTQGCRMVNTNQYFVSVVSDFQNYVTTRTKQFPSKEEDLKIPVANKPIRRRRTTSRQKYGTELPMNLGVWNMGVPTTIVPETYSLVGRELGIINWLTLS